eukprot:scaffold27178_cov56-Phaeocystis_antarctica.AAC.2
MVSTITCGCRSTPTAMAPGYLLLATRYLLLTTYYRAPTTQADPESDGPALPTSKDDEFRPFIRRRANHSYLVITP